MKPKQNLPIRKIIKLHNKQTHVVFAIGREGERGRERVEECERGKC